MDRDRQNEVAMGLTVAGVLGEDRFAGVLVTVPAFGTDKTKLEGNISAIQAIVEAQAHQSAGVTDIKTGARKKLATAACVVAGGLRRLGRQTGNADLLHQASISPSDLLYGRDQNAITIGGTINKLGAQNAAALVGVNVDAGKLSALDTAFGTFKGMIENPRKAVVDVKSATDKLPAAFSDFHMTLADLDDLAETVRETHPDFYTAYKNARIIIDRPGGLPPKKDPTPKPPQP